MGHNEILELTTGFGTHNRIWNSQADLELTTGNGVIDRSCEPPPTRAGEQDDGSSNNLLQQKKTINAYVTKLKSQQLLVNSQ